MAYTYDDFVKAATSAGAMDRFSEDDLKITKTSPEYGLSMLKLYQDQQNATTAEQKLLTQEAANQLRKTYGSSYNPLTPSFSYKGQTEYQKLLDSITNPTPFSYDPTQDPRYSAYRKGYLREADRAREDTLAAVSAGSGGVPSSYAVAAAQQAGDYHVGQLNDVIPTLYQDALNNYYTEQNQKLNALGALNTDRNFDYSAYLQQAEKDLQAAELMAGKGDYSLLGQYLGLTPEQLALLQGKKTLYTGGNPDDNTGKKTDLTTEFIERAQAFVGVNPSGKWDAESQKKAQSMGYNSLEAVISDIQGRYNPGVNSLTAGGGSVADAYDDAIKQMRALGTDEKIIDGAMTYNQWLGQRSANKAFGRGGEGSYDSYQGYIKDYIQYARNPYKYGTAH